jgi:hypothetical protein
MTVRKDLPIFIMYVRDIRHVRVVLWLEVYQLLCLAAMYIVKLAETKKKKAE